VQPSGLSIAWILAIGSFALLVSIAAYTVLMVYSHRRIGELQRAKLEEVSRSEEKYKGLFDNSIAGISRFRLDDWTIIDSNGAAREMFRCTTPEELQECLLRMPHHARDSIRNALSRDGVVDQYEIETSRRNGEAMCILFSARMVGEESAQAIVIDITERNRHKEKIREQGLLLDQAQDAILVIDAQGRITHWNTGGEEMYVWTKAEALGRHLGEMIYATSCRRHFEAAMEDVRQFKEWSGEQHNVCKDGKEIIVDSRWKAIERKSRAHHSVMIVNSDITEKKRMESQFKRAEKMESIALLTGGLAHDLQNILAPIDMSAHFLKKRLSGKSTLAVVKAIEESARSGIELVESILAYGKGVAGDRKVVNVGRLLTQVLDAVGRGAMKGVRIERKLKHQRWAVSGDANQLKQVFRNLCLNALESMPHGGVLRVESSDVEVGADGLDDMPGAESDTFVLVSVHDSGVGMEPENLDRIFEPFFTTKGQTGGTGLGLSVAHGIVQSHGGCIKVTSTMGSGTTFQVYLPAMTRGSG
jgi:two-component system cell cycle sensor histidine kinase/response regulator CckA